MIELIKQYIDTGIQLPEHQVNRLLDNKNLLITYLRKRAIAIQIMHDDWSYHEKDIIEKGIKNNFFKEGFLLELVKSNYEIIGFINNLSEPVQLAAVQQNGYLISFINNPSEDVQLAAVNKNGYVIKYIIEKGIVPSDNVQLAAVKNDIYSPNHLLSAGILPSEKVLNYFKSLNK